jgi:hypothetical protein
VEILTMNTNRLFKTTILDKNFSTMTPALRLLLFPVLSTAAEQNEYLESISAHADAIGWHLGRTDIETFQSQMQLFFEQVLKTLRGKLNFLTLAFDETFLPYYGRKSKESVWIHGYTNKIKGATGSYKFMVVSIVVGAQRFALFALPMATTDKSVKMVDNILTCIKREFHVSLVLLDRGFASKELVSTMEQQHQKYIALCPKWKNVQQFLKQGITGICETKKLVHHRREANVHMQYVLAYGLLEHDWVFLTNTTLSGMDLVRAYKARWSIETTFRVMDHADIKSKSTNIVIRSFLFLLSIVLYNMWIEQREEQEMTFTQFLDALAMAHTSLDTMIEKIRSAKEALGVPLTTQEKKILSYSVA